jgi:beta-N-acetylhexosaminidase
MEAVASAAPELSGRAGARAEAALAARRAPAPLALAAARAEFSRMMASVAGSEARV